MNEQIQFYQFLLLFRTKVCLKLGHENVKGSQLDQETIQLMRGITEHMLEYEKPNTIKTTYYQQHKPNLDWIDQQAKKLILEWIILLDLQTPLFLEICHTLWKKS